MGRLNPSRETIFSGTHGDRGMLILIFPVQLTTSRIGNLTRLIHTLLYVTIHTYIHTYILGEWDGITSLFFRCTAFFFLSLVT